MGGSSFLGGGGGIINTGQSGRPGRVYGGGGGGSALNTGIGGGAGAGGVVIVEF
jgi:hypothetical protein